MKKRILIIEDSQSMRVMLRDLLKPLGHDIAEAVDGNIGLREFRANPADLVITDIVMPNSEGLEVIQKLKKDFETVKIIAISGGGKIHASQYLYWAQAFGAHYVLSKPFDPNNLLNAVKDLLDA